MLFHINMSGKAPEYIQIKDYFKDIILKGMLQRDEKLPSTRELASMLKVSRNTVITAYNYLEDEGIIYIKRGKGAFVNQNKAETNDTWNMDWSKELNEYAVLADKMDIMKHEMIYKHGMISFKSIAPDEKLFNIEDFKRAFLNRISIEGSKILNYGYAQGYRPLIQYLTSYMQSKGVDTKNKDILVTNGFTEGFDIILSAITNPGDNILTENPTHNTAIKLMKLHKLNIIGIGMERDGMKIADLNKKVNENNIKLSYIIPSYHNPTSIVTSSQKRIEIYKIFKEKKIPIIEDGFNEELRYSGAHIAPIATLEGDGNSVIYIGSFSKILFPGMRIGWILADRNLISALESTKRSRNIHTSFLDQAILYEYLKEGNLEKYIKTIRKEYKNKYNYALECAKKYIPYSSIYGEGGLNIFIKLKGVNSRKLLKECVNKNVIFMPGDIFYIDGEGENTLRLGISRTSLGEIKKGFKIIGETIKSLQKEPLD
ncbi:MAG: PLP-dependent aminotransferase family protein [Clostridium sp.]|nr:PLP-dependent aminotransferase family protein [Clostridium sp.]